MAWSLRLHLANVPLFLHVILLFEGRLFLFEWIFDTVWFSRGMWGRE